MPKGIMASGVRGRAAAERVVPVPQSAVIVLPCAIVR
jgi:hypothetical protein